MSAGNLPYPVKITVNVVLQEDNLGQQGEKRSEYVT